MTIISHDVIACWSMPGTRLSRPSCRYIWLVAHFLSCHCLKLLVHFLVQYHEWTVWLQMPHGSRSAAACHKHWWYYIGSFLYSAVANKCCSVCHVAGCCVESFLDCRLRWPFKTGKNRVVLHEMKRKVNMHALSTSHGLASSDLIVCDCF